MRGGFCKLGPITTSFLQYASAPFSIHPCTAYREMIAQCRLCYSVTHGIYVHSKEEQYAYLRWSFHYTSDNGILTHALFMQWTLTSRPKRPNTDTILDQIVWQDLLMT
jgi:hypothetical protein